MTDISRERTAPRYLEELVLQQGENRSLTKREILWVWLRTREKIDFACAEGQELKRKALPQQRKLKAGHELWSPLERKTFNPDMYDSRKMLGSLAQIIRGRGLTRELAEEFSTTFIPDSAFGWMGHKGRCLNWVHKKIQRNKCQKIYDLPPLLDTRVLVQAHMDFWSAGKTEKDTFLKNLARQWQQFIEEDADYSWFKKGTSSEIKTKCEIAYEWLKEKDPLCTKHLDIGVAPVRRFASLSDVQMCMDDSGRSTKLINSYISEIKKAYNAFRTKERRKGKKQTNVDLTKEAQTMLRSLAKRSRLTQKEVIERLIRDAKKNGMPAAPSEATPKKPSNI